MKDLVSYTRVHDETARKRILNTLALASIMLVLVSVYTVLTDGLYYVPEVLTATAGNCFAWVAYFLWIAKIKEGAQPERFFAIAGLLATGFGTLLLGGSQFLPGERLPVYFISLGAIVFMLYSTFLGFITSHSVDKVDAEVIEAIVPEDADRSLARDE
jgi:hypothetical protein